VGLGAFPVATAFVRHSCAPNSVALYRGRTLVLAAARNIEPGEDVTVNRLPLIWRLPDHLKERAQMRALGAVCHCEACLLRWPRELDLHRCVDDDLTLKRFLLLTLRERRSSAVSPLAWLAELRSLSDLTESAFSSQQDRVLYILHGATNGQLLKCLHYVYGLVKGS